VSDEQPFRFFQAPQSFALHIPKKLDQSSLIKLVIPKSRTAANRELVWFLAATRTRSGSGELASLAGVLRVHSESERSWKRVAQSNTQAQNDTAASLPLYEQGGDQYEHSVAWKTGNTLEKAGFRFIVVEREIGADHPSAPN
jgi:hypothetical protein